MRGADQADTDRNRCLAADPHDAAFLQRAQQLDLHGQWHVADLIEKQRAAVGLLEHALLGSCGASECAFLVTEQLGFEQAFGERATVDGNKGLVGTSQLVQGLCHTFLADAGFARDQDRGLAGRQAVEHGFNLPHDGGSPQAAGPEFANWRGDIPDLFNQRVQIKGLGDVVVRAFFQQAHGGVNVAVAGDEDEGRQLDGFAEQLLKQRVACHVGQTNITEDQRVILHAQRRQC